MVCPWIFFLVVFFFLNQCRNSFLSPGLSPSEHRGSLNAVCVQPPVSSVILHARGGSLPFTNISPAALPPEHHLSIEIGIWFASETRGTAKHCVLNVHGSSCWMFTYLNLVDVRLSPRSFQVRFWVVFATFELLFPGKVEKTFYAKMEFFTYI